MKMLKLITALLTVTMFTLVGCKKDNDASDGKGTFTANMTDGPGNYSALYVQVTKVEIYRQGGGWVTLSNQTRNVNVINLTNGASTSLATDTRVEAGLYSRMRITFGNNNTIMVNNSGGSSTFNLTFVSDTHKQVEFEIHEQVSAGSHSEVLVDFNVTRSVTESLGNYFLKPCMNEIRDYNTGVKGKLETAAYASVILRADGSVEDSLSTYSDANGYFIFRGMGAGTYDIIIQPTDADVANGADAYTTVDNVVIVEGEVKNLGTINVNN